MELRVLFACLGTLGGLAYAGLGVAALKHLADGDENDRTYGWTLWWFAERSRYSARGKRLCTIGGVVFVLALVFWAGWFILAPA